LERLEQASGQLEAALKPFGKLPSDIEKVSQEIEEAMEEAYQKAKSTRR
jgi:hypothetical protein